MNKNIAVCIDGTGNEPDDIQEEGHSTTNVFRLYEALSEEVTKQYFKGVATTDMRLIDEKSRITGAGADRIRNNAFAYLKDHYRPGDQIFLFGFSRGAAIVRDLANLIAKKGFPSIQQVPIRMLGLWDTVAAFGIPIDLSGLPLQETNLGKELDIPLNVRHVYHLLAIDETRSAFQPTLIDVGDKAREADTRIEVWFPGVHADVGGGMKERRFADNCLLFMIECAQQHGLSFKPEKVREIQRNEEGEGCIQMHKGRLAGERRKIVVLENGKVSPVLPKIHQSAINRMARLEDYRPENVIALGEKYEIVREVSSMLARRIPQP